MVVKRKREFYATPVSNDQDAATSTPDVLSDTVPVTLSPFTIEYTKPGDTKPKKPRASVKSAINSNDHTTTKQEQGVEATDPPVSYMVMPGSMWESMKKYKNFIVIDKQFGVNDFVYINNGELAQWEETDDDKKFWIARVLEVRASSPSAVYLRVYWMYWPSELHSGPEYYHGKSELVASNHMEIIDAMTVAGKAEVTHLMEEEDAPTATGLYWRQKLNFQSGKVSVLKTDCVCEMYHNPDQLLVHCVSPSCGKWMHEDCLLNDALDRSWAKLNGTDHLETPNDTIEVNGNHEGEGTIQLKSTMNKAPAMPTKKGGRTQENSLKSKTKRKSKGKKNEALEPEWNGKLKAVLDKKPSADDKEESTEITGMVIIRNLEEKWEPWKEPLSCLFCHHSLL